LNEWQSFLNSFINDEEDRYTLLRSVETYCGTVPKFNSVFHIIIQVFYTQRLLKRTHILKWNEQAVNSLKKVKNEDEEEEEFEHYDDIFEIIEPAKREKFIKNMEKFVTGLKGMGEEDESEEEEEDEEEEEEDEDEGEDLNDDDNERSDEEDK
jgi:hypothetical protein